MQEPRNFEAIFFGLWPSELPSAWGPWLLLSEVLILKLIAPEICLTGSVSGILIGLAISFAIHFLSDELRSYCIIPGDTNTYVSGSNPPDLTSRSGISSNDQRDESSERLVSSTQSKSKRFVIGNLTRNPSMPRLQGYVTPRNESLNLEGLLYRPRSKLPQPIESCCLPQLVLVDRMAKLKSNS
jgi:hypothetical protein